MPNMVKNWRKQSCLNAESYPRICTERRSKA